MKKKMDLAAGAAGQREPGRGDAAGQKRDAPDREGPPAAGGGTARRGPGGVPGACAAHPAHPAGTAAENRGRPGCDHGLAADGAGLCAGTGLRCRPAEPVVCRDAPQLRAAERVGQGRRRGCGHGEAAAVCLRRAADRRDRGGEHRRRKDGASAEPELQKAGGRVHQAGRDDGRRTQGREAGRSPAAAFGRRGAAEDRGGEGTNEPGCIPEEGLAWA